MSQPLPNGYVDTQITFSYTTACKLRTLKYNEGAGGANFAEVQGNEQATAWRVEGHDNISGPHFPDGHLTLHEEIQITGPGGLSVTVESSDTDYNTTPPGGSPDAIKDLIVYHLSNEYPFTESGGPYRLGRKYKLRDGAPGPPNFGPRDFEDDYQWFADENTSVVQTLDDGTTVHTYTWYPVTNSATPPVGGETPVGNRYVLAWMQGTCNCNRPPGPHPPAYVGDLCRFNDIAINGVDPPSLTNLDDGIIHGVTSNDIAGYGNGTSGFIVAAPHQFTYDVTATYNGTTAPNAIQFKDGYLTQAGYVNPAVKTYLTFPTDNSAYSAPIATWHTDAHQLTPSVSSPGVGGGLLWFEVYSTWAAAQDPPLNSLDYPVPLRGAKLTDPSLREPYQPVSLQFAATLDVFRPDGNRPSDFTALDGNTAVTEHTSSTDFLVSGSTLGAKRTLLTSWRDWIDPLNMAYFADGYRKLVHDSGEDIFWWSTYAWLKLTWNAPASFTLTVKLDYTLLEVATPGSTPYTQHTGSATYTVAVASGTHDYHLDLLLPGGVETYIGRVDAITVSGFPVNASPFTLSAMTLEARDDAYVKHAMGIPASGGDYSVPVLSIAGSWALGSIPPDRNKADEDNPDNYGGDPIYVHPGADQALLTEYWTGDGEVGMDAIEGITVAYSSAVSDAAIKDGFGTALAPENADWVEPTVPSTRLAAATDWKPTVTPNSRQLRIPNCQPFLVYVDHSLWGGLESVAMDGSARASAGAHMTARRTDTGATAGAGTTDSWGYVEVTPIPANGSKVWELVQA